MFAQLLQVFNPLLNAQQSPPDGLPPLSSVEESSDRMGSGTAYDDEIGLFFDPLSVTTRHKEGKK